MPEVMKVILALIPSEEGIGISNYIQVLKQFVFSYDHPKLHAPLEMGQNTQIIRLHLILGIEVDLIWLAHKVNLKISS